MLVLPLPTPGNYDGTEVAQLYIRDMVGSVTRPVKELKGFRRIFLKKGESKTVTFDLTMNDLSFYRKDIDLGYRARRLQSVCRRRFGQCKGSSIYASEIGWI